MEEATLNVDRNARRRRSLVLAAGIHFVTAASRSSPLHLYIHHPPYTLLSSLYPSFLPVSFLPPSIYYSSPSLYISLSIFIFINLSIPVAYIPLSIIRSSISLFTPFPLYLWPFFTSSVHSSSLYSSFSAPIYSSIYIYPSITTYLPVAI